jgi:hypothetical protein
VTTFIRRNLITINAQFVPPGYCAYINGVAQPPPVQPTTAVAVLLFPVASGAQVTAVIPMTLGSDGITWSCVWDSSACSGGECSWVVYASGAVQSAAEGGFTILANPANTF